MSKRILFTGLAIIGVFVLVFGWRQLRHGADGQGGGAMPPVAVQAAVVQPRPVEGGIVAVGTVEAVREVVLSADTAGRVVAIRFEAGRAVRQGDAVVELYSAPEQADRAAAKARADFARLQLARSEQLAPTGAEPRELLEQRRAEYAQARAAIAQLDARIAQKTVRAPFAGRLGIRQVNPGQYLNPGDPIVTLTALDRLYVNFTLPQQELSRVRPGAEVRVTADAWPERQFSARVSAIEPVVGRDTRNIMVQATLANPDEALRPGMYVSARLVLPAGPPAIVVPLTAIQTSASGESVIVVRGPNPRREGEAVVVPVRTGDRIGDEIVVNQGLKPGDVVVTLGQVRIQPGAKVAPKLAAAAPAAAR